jgi:hypothetical protein
LEVFGVYADAGSVAETGYEFAGKLTPADMKVGGGV